MGWSLRHHGTARKKLRATSGAQIATRSSSARGSGELANVEVLVRDHDDDDDLLTGDRAARPRLTVEVPTEITAGQPKECVHCFGSKDVLLRLIEDRARS